jgi:DNA-binding response OmpR family regulator
MAEDQAEGRSLTDLLCLHGYDVLWALAVAEAVELASRESPALILMCAGGAGHDAGEPVRRLRSAADGALVVLISGRWEESAVIEVLDRGADDVIAGPVVDKVLVARVRAHLRRNGYGGAPRQSLAIPAGGDLFLNPVARQAVLAGRELPLRPKEFDVLTYLVSRCGQVVSHEDLITDVWRYDDSPSTTVIKAQVYALRRKLHRLAVGAGTIVTVRGHGYRFDLPRHATSNL